MLGQMEHADLGALVAPRPLLVQSGDQDILFPVATAAEALSRVRPLYERVDAGDRLAHDVFVGIPSNNSLTKWSVRSATTASPIHIRRRRSSRELNRCENSMRQNVGDEA